MTYAAYLEHEGLSIGVQETTADMIHRKLAAPAVLHNRNLAYKIEVLSTAMDNTNRPKKMDRLHHYSHTTCDITQRMKIPLGTISRISRISAVKIETSMTE